MLGVLAYLVAKPRASVRIEEGPRIAAIGADGEPDLPARPAVLPRGTA